MPSKTALALVLIFSSATFLSSITIASAEGIAAPAPVAPVAPAPSSPVAPAPSSPVGPAPSSPVGPAPLVPSGPTSVPLLGQVDGSLYGSNISNDAVRLIANVQQSVTNIGSPSNTLAGASVNFSSPSLSSPSPVTYSPPVIAPAPARNGITVSFAQVMVAPSIGGTIGAPSSSSSNSGSASVPNNPSPTTSGGASKSSDDSKDDANNVAITVGVRNSTSGASAPIENQNLVIRGNESVSLAVAGLQPNSEVFVYMFSEPTFVGKVMTNASGNFAGALPTPKNLPDGNHTLRMGVSLTNGSVAAISLPITLNQKTERITTRYCFANGASALSKAQIKEINSSVKSLAGRKILGININGFLPSSSASKVAKKVALQRAKLVSRYFNKLDVSGNLAVSTTGIAPEKGKRANLLEVSVITSKE